MTVIDTRLGRIKGIDHGTSLSFLGIRYGEPPIGSLRFMPPLASGPWNGLLDATNYPNRAMQSNKTGTMGQDTPGELSEDCLFLNIYTPSTEISTRPVMVWIHGGGFRSGSANEYDGRVLASQGDVLVVTVNYRLGPFDRLYATKSRSGLCECSLEVFLDCVESFVFVWRCSAVFLEKAAKTRAFIAVLLVL